MFAEEKIRREELEIFQLERLKKIVAWAYDKSNFYRKSFQRRGVLPEEIQTLADVRKLPFTTREEIQTDALDILTLPLSSVIRISRREGFTKFFTRGDVRNNVEMMIRALVAANVLRGSVVGVRGDLTDSRIFDALYALESIGATAVLLGEENFFGVDTFITAAENFSAADENFLKIILLNSAGIQSPFPASKKIFNLFAPPEIGHAGFCFQCAESNFHVQEDFFLTEILDGELVVTSLTAQAFPLIRLRTELFVRRIDEPCPCGRTFARIAAF